MSQTGIEKTGFICHQTLECRQLKKVVKWICLHPLCNSFLEMCDSCYVSHVEYHKINKLDYEADLPNPIIRYEAQKENVEKILNKVTIELNAVKDKINQEIKVFATAESPVEPVIEDIKSIKQQVISLFDELIEKIQEETHQKKSDKLRTIYQEVTAKLQETCEYQALLSQPDMIIQSMRDISIFDLEYQTQVQRARMEQILDECAIKYDDRQIDEDVVLKLISSVKQNLENILSKPNSEKKTQKQNIKQSLDSRFQIKNWLFYFEPYTKNFHYINIADPFPQFKVSQLAIDFVIQPGNRSILASDNCIYLVGGYDPNLINSENEQQYKNVYKLNFEKSTLQKVSSLITLRHSFGLCQFQNCLYIVGGYNYIEGSLAKCEKIPLDGERYTNSIPVNNLQKRSSHLTVASWKNRILVKFGGILLDQNIPALKGKIGKSVVVSDNLTEYYMPEYDYWVQMQTLNYPSTFLSNSIEINNQLIIFGGLAINQRKQNNSTTTSSTTTNSDQIATTNNLIRMVAYNIENLDIEISKSSSLPESCYSISQPLLKETAGSRKKKVYFLGFDNLDYKNPTLKPTLKYFDI